MNKYNNNQNKCPQKEINFLLKVFTNRKRYGTSDVLRDENGKKKNFRTHSEHDILTDTEFTRLHQHADKTLYLRMGETTNVFILDVDRDSPYHPHNNQKSWLGVTELIEKKFNVRGIVTKSSSSGGLHVIYPLKNEVNSDKLAHVVWNTLENNGHSVRNGSLEIFPNKRNSTTSLYTLIRVPGQNDWGMYKSRQTLNTVESTLKDLENRWKYYESQNDITSVLESLEVELETTKTTVSKPAKQKKVKERSFQPAPWQESFPQDLSGMYKHLQCLLENGFTDRHQTNELLSIFTRLMYILIGKTDVEELGEIVRSLKGFDEYCGHQKDIEKRIKDFVQMTTKNNKYFVQKCKTRLENFTFYIGKTIDKLTGKNTHKDKHEKTSVKNRLVEACKILNANLDMSCETKTSYMKELCKHAHMSMQTVNKYFDEFVNVWFERKNQTRCNSLHSKTSNHISSSLTKLVLKEEYDLNTVTLNNTQEGSTTEEDVSSTDYRTLMEEMFPDREDDVPKPEVKSFGQRMLERVLAENRERKNETMFAAMEEEQRRKEEIEHERNVLRFFEQCHTRTRYA